MLDSGTWRDVLGEAAGHTPDKVVFSYLPDDDRGTVELTYRDLHLRATAIAAHLVEQGLSGQTAMLLYPFGLDYVEAFFGCLYAGTIAVPAYPPGRQARALERFMRIVQDCGAQTALTTEALKERLGKRHDLPGTGSPRLIATDTRAPGPSWTPPPLRADDLAFLQYTSGSTAAPRGVMLSHANLLANTALIKELFGLSRETRAVSWLPLYHDMGLIGSVLGTVSCGGSTLLLSPASFARDPYRWLRAISDYRATVSGGPNFAFDMCVDRITPEQRATLDLSCWQVAFNGAEPIRPRTLRRFADAFSGAGLRESALLACYGLAESALIVTAGPARTSRDQGTETVSCGRIPESVRLEIVDPDGGGVRPDGTVGEIWIAGASVAGGYWGRPPQPASVFGARLAGREGSYLRTGDLGFRRDGELYVTGRSKDLIIIRGRNHYPQDIEATVEDCGPELWPHGAAAFTVEADGESLVVLQEMRREHTGADLAGIAENIRAAVAAHHEVRPATVVLLRAGGLPRTSSGKIARHACRQAFLDGGLPALFSLTDGPAPAKPAVMPAQDELTDVLTAEAASVLGTDAAEVPVTRPLLELGLDSLDAVTLAHRISARLEREISAEDLLPVSIAELVSGLAERAPVTHRPPVQDQPGDYALSCQQRGMHFLHELAPGNTAYLLSAALDVRGALDVGLLRRCLEATVARHSALRTTFPSVGGKVVQRVHADLPPLVHVEDVADAGRLAELSATAAQTPLDPQDGPLVRLTVLRSAPDRHRLVFAVHHLVADLWSLELILRELTGRYRGLLPSPAAVPGFVSVVAEEEVLVSGDRGAESLAFWRTALDGVPYSIDLAADRVRPPAQRFRGGACSFTVDPETTDRLRRVAEQYDATLYSVLLAAYATLVWRYSGRSDFLIGSPVHGRGRPGSADIVGSCINIVPIRCRLAAEEPVSALIRRLHDTSRDALRHADLPFVVLADKLRASGDLSRSPLIQVMFALQRTAQGEGPVAAMAVNHPGVRGTFGDAVLETVELPRTGAQVDLTLQMAELGGMLAGELVYNADLFDEASADRMARQFAALLTGIADDPGASARALSVLDRGTSQDMEREWADTAVEYERDGHLHVRFAEQARRTPDALAVVHHEPGRRVALTYAELDRAANRLAHHLIGLGVRPGHVVALHLPRSADMPVAILAVLKSGGTYLPIDPGLPRQRIDFMLADSRAEVLIGAAAEGVRVHVDPARIADVLAAEPETAPGAAVHPESTAYIIYTSGSTGRPKGVAVPHRAVNNFLAAVGPVLAMSSGTRTLGVARFAFDVSVQDMGRTLLSGGTYHVVHESILRDGQELRALVEATGFTHIQATPATWRLLLDAGWTGSPGLTILTGGEAISGDLARRLVETGSPVRNMYGPTETTIWSSTASIDAETARSPHIGRALSGNRLYVLDDLLTRVPAGVPGELHIGGDAVAHGYVGRPGLTADKFVPDPFTKSAGKRMYATGDLVRMRADGALEYLGRLDNQVKLNGLRIELEEIESVLDRHPDISRSVVSVHRGDRASVLIGYLVPATERTDRAQAEQAVLRDLRIQLPGYMVPGRLVWMDALPLNANGKVDRQALPPLPRPAVTSAASEPEAMTAEERRLADIVCEVLEVPAVGRETNLFDIGGQSLTISQLASRITEVFGVRLPLLRIFESPTVAGLAALLASGERQPALAPPITAVDRKQYVAGTRSGSRRIDVLRRMARPEQGPAL
ncbi:amino acid adenylation domain-containing protein [Nonomuraea sp. NPDC004186]